MSTLFLHQRRIQDLNSDPLLDVRSSGSRLSFYAKNGRTIPYVKLVPKPTPIVSGALNGFNFDIKREDLTSLDLYGGNKVRNLEFILADALLNQRSSIATPIPVGSNFSAAFVAHSQRLGLHPIPCQVNLASHPQIEDHFEFCMRRNAEMHTRDGFYKFPLQMVDLMRAKLFSYAYLVSPGGSNTLGALGHLKAFDEVILSIQNQTLKMPTHIFAGAGTGGTTAGLLAAIHIAQLPIKIMAVRCAETVICNRFRIVSLANKLLKFLGYDSRVDDRILELVECPGHERYGEPLAEFVSINHQFYIENGFSLDRTYTSKVIQFMMAYQRQDRSETSRYLYWHTYSNVATQERLKLRTST